MSLQNYLQNILQIIHFTGFLTHDKSPFAPAVSMNRKDGQFVMKLVNFGVKKGLLKIKVIKNNKVMGCFLKGIFKRSLNDGKDFKKKNRNHRWEWFNISFCVQGFGLIRLLIAFVYLSWTVRDGSQGTPLCDQRESSLWTTKKTSQIACQCIVCTSRAQ